MALSDMMKRLASLEARRSPLARSHDLVRRRVPLKDWPQPELEAFCAESPEIAAMSNEQLEVLALEPYDDLA